MDHHELPNPINLIRYGSSQPLPEQHLLHAGPLTMQLENGTIKYIKCGQLELIRQIYSAVRNENWETVLPQFSRVTIEQREISFSVHFEAVHKDNPIDFIWQGNIEGESDGTIRYTMEGVARESFLKNRIGFCILHPMEMAGLSVEVETTDGPKSGSFPLLISPHQPFFNITAMKQKLTQNIEYALIFTGDTFEMEDQRNWTDASFKTYCTPLGIPYPVEISQGSTVKQMIELKVKVSPQESISPASSSPPMQSVRIKEKKVGSLPNLGLIYSVPLNEWERKYLDRLQLAHLRVELNIGEADWLPLLSQAADEADRIGAKLEIEAIVGDQGQGLSELLRELKANHISIGVLLLFVHSSMISTESIIRQAQALMEEIGWRVRLGAGSRLYFAELNRLPIPLELIESVHYPVNPQVHAFDNESIIETLAVQAVTLNSAKALSGELPIAVGPITLFSRINKQDNLPKKTDPRQISLFCAGWTLGSIRHLAQAGASALTYYEITGKGGIMDRQIGLFPVYHIFAEIGKLKKTAASSEPIELMEVVLGDPLKVEALAIKKASQIKLLIANLHNEAQNVQVEFPSCPITQVRILDERTAIEAMSDPEQFGLYNGFQAEEAMSSLNITMLPYAVCIIDLFYNPGGQPQ